MSLVIPLDVVENIIDTLVQYDPKLSSTKACSLVSHAFLSICRKHIFSSVNVTSEQPLYPWRPLIIRGKPPRIPVRTFVRVLAASPVLLDYIRNLKYWIAWTDLYDPALPETFKRLNRLRSLSIVQTVPNEYTPWIELRFIFFHILSIPLLEELTIGGITDFLLADLARSRNLSSFSFTGVTFSVTPSGGLPSPSTIHSLEVGSYNNGSSPIAPLRSAKCADGSPFINLSSLLHLSVTVHNSKDAETCRSLLQICAQLISVKITMQGFGFGDVYNPGKVTFDMICLAELASISTLKRLSVHTGMHACGDLSDIYLGLHYQLEQMADNNNVIEMISITVSIIGIISADYIAEQKWERLDEVLESTGWPCLQRVSLNIIIYSFSPSDGENIVNELKSRSEVQFPRLLSRKGLEFDFFAQQMYGDS